METINDDIENDAGIVLVMNKDRKLAKKEYGISKFPALGLFKNGAEVDNFVVYDGDLRDVAAVLNWLSDTETMEIAGNQICLFTCIKSGVKIMQLIWQIYSICQHTFFRMNHRSNRARK